jgi:curved DNA-binding protein CbpA
MVTEDVKRDYYADLGLTPEVDDEALKKQYRKLGT